MGSPTVRFCVVAVAQFDDESVLANVRGDALQLEGLETGPSEEGSVGRGEFAETLGEVLVGEARHDGVLLCARYLVRSVLANRLV